ncbi:MAG: DUF2125 domain-containing protein [Rhodospirillales bacterium]|nr:DUF2125 domain-containing protein [Rhodospirillales bacterium]
MRLRSLVLLVSFILFLAVVALALYWRASAARLSEFIASWTAYQQAQGYEISYQGPEIGGFPFALTARFRDPGMVSPQGWHWRGPEISGRAALWDPLTIELELSGRHLVAPRGAETPTEATLVQASARVHLHKDGQVERATAESAAIEVRSGQVALTAAKSAWQLGPLRPAQGETPQELLFAGELDDLVLPEDRAGPLGPQLRRLAVEALLVGRIPDQVPGQALAAGQRHFLEQWRDGGGLLKLERVELSWGPLALEGDGALSLDRQLRPLGAFTATTKGLMETLDVLTAKGVLEPGKALPAKVGLLALGARKDEAGNPVIVLPITLQDGLLYLGPKPLLQLFPLL